jgi:very-short-patch-repair endonuclease
MKNASSTPFIRELRRELRQRQTDAETLLWSLIRNRQLAGAKFRRQHSFGRFIVDFCCIEHRLVIEVDGAIHHTPEARAADAEREAILCDLGLSILRFSNDEVLYKMEYVLAKIRENLT